MPRTPSDSPDGDAPIRNAQTEITKREFCDLFGVSESQLERFFQKGMPQRKASTRNIMIPMPAGRIWFHEYLVEKGKKAAQPKSIDEARRRTETARAEMAELDLSERRAETMKVADHERLLADAFSRVGAKLTTFAARAASASFGALTIEDAETKIEPVVSEIREELRRADDVPLDEDDELDETTEDEPESEDDDSGDR